MKGLGLLRSARAKFRDLHPTLTRAQADEQFARTVLGRGRVTLWRWLKTPPQATISQTVIDRLHSYLAEDR